MSEFEQIFIGGLLSTLFGLFVYMLKKLNDIEKDYLRRFADTNRDNANQFVSRSEFETIIQMLHNDLSEIKQLLKEFLSKGDK